MMNIYKKPAIHVVAVEGKLSILEVTTLQNNQGGTQLSKPCGTFNTFEEPYDSENKEGHAPTFSIRDAWD